jgi:hypothetical protein
MSHDPTWVEAILQAPWSCPVARTAVVAIFPVSAIAKMIHFDAAIKEQQSAGAEARRALGRAHHRGAIARLRPGYCGTFRLGGGRSVGGVYSAGGPDQPRFWTMKGEVRFANTNAFIERIGLIGGLIMTALLPEYSIAARRGPTSPVIRPFNEEERSDAYRSSHLHAASRYA